MSGNNWRWGESGVPMMRRAISLAGLVALMWAASAAAVVAVGEADTRQSARQDLCGPSDQSPKDLARQLAGVGEPARDLLVRFSNSSDRNEVLCGIAGLSALGDRRVIPALVAALRNPAMREDAYLLARWGTALAGGPAADLGPAMRDVVDVFSDPGVWSAAGNDAAWLLGDIDVHTARDRLLAELDRSTSDAALDAVIHGLARQGDPRARARISALGADALRAKSGNATPEQASRLGEVAFYQLALGPETLGEGLATLGTVALRDQEWAAAWAVHTLCARAVRRPSERAAIEAHRLTLVEDLGRRGVSWSDVKGPFGCEPQR